jgi:hypothetical protein
VTQPMIEVYTSATSATPPPATAPAQDLQRQFPWLATSTSSVVGQAWFWTPAWRAGEREVDRNIAAGRTTSFDSDEDFLAALDREMS